MGRHIGVDLGTTNSAMAYVVDEDVEIIENNNGEPTTPSVIWFNDGEVTVGKAAKNKLATKSDQIVTRVKDKMGTDETVSVNGEEKTPAEVSANILEKLVADAEDKMGDDVDGVVITVPYYFGEPAREATRDAADIAGIEVDRLINEPTAACYAYGLKEDDFEGTALIYDFGGGTFDATLVEIGAAAIDVIGTAGSEDLGGENLNDELYEYVRQEMIDQGLTDPDSDDNLKGQVHDVVVDAKEDLSSSKSTSIGLYVGETFDLDVSRSDFEDLIEGHINRTIDDIDTLFDDDKVDISAADVDEVILVGGSTYIPAVQDRVEEYFGIEPTKSVNADHAVAIGAAVEAATYEGAALPGDEPRPVFDVLSHSLGVATLPRGADQANDPDLVFDAILEKNERVPADYQKTYTTAVDNQTTVDIEIHQGEAKYAKDSDKIGEFQLQDISPRPAGEPELEVTFDVNEEGILTAEVEDKGMGDTASVTLDDSLGLSEEEKEEIKSQKEQLAQDD